MKITKNQLRKIVKTVLNEMLEADAGSNAPSHFLQGDNTLFIENLRLEDGRVIDAKVRLKGASQNTGVGSNEFQGQPGYDQGTTQFDISEYWVIEVLDSASGATLWQKKGTEKYKPVDPAAAQEILGYVEENLDKIESELNSTNR